MHDSRFMRLLLTGIGCASASMLLAAPPGGGGGGGAMPSVSAPNFDVAAEYRTGVEALKAGNYADAKKSFDHILTAVPQDANSNFLAGMSSAGMGDLKGARHYYERAVRADKNLVEAHRELGLTYAKTGEWAKARAELDRLKAMQGKCAAGCDKAADIGAAVDALNSALAGAPQAALEPRPSLLFTSPQIGDAAYLKAIGLINDGRYEQAIDSLEAAAKTFGPHPDILTYLGYANRKLGRLDAAEGYYRAALASSPRHRAASEYYGELMVERGDRPGAQRMLASLEASCTFGCAEADELRRWIEAGHEPTR